MSADPEVARPTEWRRLHPVTIVRELLGVAWNLVVAVVVLGALDGGPARLEALLPVVFFVLAVARYLSTRYRITDEAVLWRRGVLFRRRVQVPRSRIQNVSSGADVLGRIFGLRTVTISTAGSEGEIELALVTSEEASFLLGELLGPAAVGTADLAAPPAYPPAAPPEPGTRWSEPTPAGSAPPADPPVPSPSGPRPPEGRPGRQPEGGPGRQPVGGPGRQPVPSGPPPVLLPGAPGAVVGGPPAGRRLVSLSGRELAVYALTGSVMGGFSVISAVGLALIIGSPGPLLILLLGAAPVFGTFDLVDFQLTAERDRLRVRHGLLQTRDKWARRERVQLLAVDRPLVRAAVGYETVRLATADATVGRDADLSLCHPLAGRGSWPSLAAELLEPTALTEAGLHPISPRARLRRTVRLCVLGSVPGAAVVVVLGLAVGAAVAAGVALVVLAAVAGAAWSLAGRAQRLDGWAADEQHLLVRRGLVGSRLWLVRRAKVQSVTVLASPFQRRLGLASLHVDAASVSGGAIVVPDLSRDEALALARDLVASADRVYLPDGV